MYDNFNRVPADDVPAGDICAVTGLPDLSIGETICDRETPIPLPTITVRPHRRPADQCPLVSCSGVWASAAACTQIRLRQGIARTLAATA